MGKKINAFRNRFNGLHVFLRMVLVLGAVVTGSAVENHGSPIVIISMSFDAPNPSAGVLIGHIKLTDNSGAPAALADDVTVQVSCDNVSGVVITQPPTIPAGTTSADFEVELTQVPCGRPLQFTGDTGFFGFLHATLSIVGVAN
jgi:hypothetical protein